MKKTLNYILITITALFFLLALYVMVFGAIARKNNELLSVFGYSYSAVPTNSMDGDGTYDNSFKAGSFVILKKVPFESIEVEDIIVFQDNSTHKLIIHRVIEINEDGSLVTKGDNVNAPIDSIETTKDNYQAKMIKSFSFFGLGSKIGSYQLMILAILIVVLIVYIVYQVFYLIIHLHKRKLQKFKQENKK